MNIYHIKTLFYCWSVVGTNFIREGRSECKEDHMDGQPGLYRCVANGVSSSV